MRLRIFSCAYRQFVYLLLRSVNWSSAHLKMELFIFWLLRYKSSSYIMVVIRHDLQKMFSYVVGCLFTFLRVSFKAQRFLILIKVQFTLFPLLSLLLALCLRNYCLIQGNKVWYLCFLLGVLQFWFLCWALIYSVSLLF